jgi:hypothetical protein
MERMSNNMMLEPFLSAMALTIFLASSMDCSLFPPLWSDGQVVLGQVV